MTMATSNCGFRIADCGLAVCDFGLPIAWIVQELIVFNLRCDFFALHLFSPVSFSLWSLVSGFSGLFDPFDLFVSGFKFKV